MVVIFFTDTTQINHLLALYDGKVACVANCLIDNSMPAPIAPTSTAAPAEDFEAGVDYSPDNVADLFGSTRFMCD